MQTQAYDQFIGRIKRKAHHKRFPLGTMLELTHRCNFRCVHCYITDGEKRKRVGKELKTKEVYDLLRELRDLGGLYLALTGGEIFLREDLLDIIQFARGLGFNVMLLTNGSLIDPGKADRLKELGVINVDITIHAVDEDIFDQITQVSGSAQRVFNAIRLLKERNIPLTMKSTAMRTNKKEMTKIHGLARQWKTPFRFDGELIPCHDHSRGPLDLSLTEPEVFALKKRCYPERFPSGKMEEEVRVLDKFKKIRLQQPFHCGAGYHELTISPYGEIKICVALDYPKYQIKNGNMAEGWGRVKDFVDQIGRDKDWACRRCDLVPFCSWCPAMAYLHDGSFIHCDPACKRKAEFYRRQGMNS